MELALRGHCTTLKEGQATRFGVRAPWGFKLQGLRLEAKLVTPLFKS